MCFSSIITTHLYHAKLHTLSNIQKATEKLQDNLLLFRIEARATAVAVQQPSLECTAIFTMRTVEHHPPLCAVTIHKAITGQQWVRLQDSGINQDQRLMCWQHTNTLILANRPRGGKLTDNFFGDYPRVSPKMPLL